MISVIIPIYNSDKYIERCLESVINQTYKDLEIIVVDDGSTDNSLALCSKYKKKDRRIKVFSQKNQGPIMARKKGLCNASGQYIAFVDSDDYIESDMYERLFHVLEESSADFVHTGFYVGNNERIIGTIEGKYNFYTKEDRESFINKYIFNYENSDCISPSMWSKLYRKEYIEKCISHIPNTIIFGEDLLLLYICIMESGEIVALDEAYYHYEDNTSSITHQSGMNKLSEILKLYQEMSRLLVEYEAGRETCEKAEEYTKWVLSTYLMRMTKLNINRYIIKDISRFWGKKVIIYGAGQVGQDVYAQISKYKKIDIVAWIDKKRNSGIDYFDISDPSAIVELDYDYIVVAVKNKKIIEEIVEELIHLGVAYEKIISKEIGIWI